MSGSPQARQSKPWLLAIIAFVIAFDLAFFCQKIRGAYESEFGGHPDEAAHYVTGLMIRDYIAAGCPGNPMKFADDYYRHYPKIGLGVWPPFFYLVQSAWTLPFGVSRTSVLLLMAALAGIVATLVYRMLREEYGELAGWFGLVLMITLPLAQEYYSMVMAETLSAALMFGAAVAFGNFLDREKTADSVWFGVLAGLAIMTKGTGLALAFIPPLALIASRKWHLLMRPAFWGGGALTLVIAGPWTWRFRDEGRLKGGWLQPTPGWNFTREAIPHYLGKVAAAFGLNGTLTVAIGVLLLILAFLIVFERSIRSAFPGRWICCGALIFGVFVFQIIMPVGLEARHLIPIFPALIVLFVAGLMELGGWRRAKPNEENSTAQPPLFRKIVAGVIVVAIFVSAVVATKGVRKGFSGFRSVAQMISEHDPQTKGIILVSSEARGEGMFISELAMREKRPGHIVQRATKELASMEWSGSGYRQKFGSDDTLIDFLEERKYAYLVVDDTVPAPKRGEHLERFRRVIEQHPDIFYMIGKSQIERGNEIQDTPIKVYRTRYGN